ncbi:calmodulin [Nymphaea colorata]|nr:calmodulin [Nymphaea colorata]
MPKQPPAFDPTIYATKNLPVDDIVRLKECFDIFDYDKSGNVSTEELATPSGHSASKKKLERFSISCRLSPRKLKWTSRPSCKSSDSTETAREFAEICESVGERFSQAEIEQMIEYADKDRDGRINYKEFFDVVTKEYPQI